MMSLPPSLPFLPFPPPPLLVSYLPSHQLLFLPFLPSFVYRITSLPPLPPSPPSDIYLSPSSCEQVFPPPHTPPSTHLLLSSPPLCLSPFISSSYLPGLAYAIFLTIPSFPSSGRPSVLWLHPVFHLVVYFPPLIKVLLTSSLLRLIRPFPLCYLSILFFILCHVHLPFLYLILVSSSLSFFIILFFWFLYFPYHLFFRLVSSLYSVLVSSSSSIFIFFISCFFYFPFHLIHLLVPSVYFILVSSSPSSFYLSLLLFIVFSMSCHSSPRALIYSLHVILSSWWSSPSPPLHLYSRFLHMLRR